MSTYGRGMRLGRFSLAGLACLVALHSAHRASAAPPEKKALVLKVVEEGTGRPIEGVAINARVGKASAKTQTDAQGSCSIDLPEAAPSYVSIGAKKDGFVPVSVEWRDQGDRKVSIPGEHTLALEKGTTIGGLIRDEKGNPVAGATVFVLVPSNDPREPGRPRPSIWDHEAKTDAEGRWRCDVVPAKLDDVWLRLSHPDFASDTMYGTTPKPSLESLRDRSGVMILKKGITVSGRVLTADGKPVVGAKVAQGSDRFGSHYPEAKTDEAGQFRFSNARAGEMILTVQAAGLAPDLKRIQVAPGLEPVEFRLEPGRKISGQIVDPQGQPVAGAFVAADTWRGHRSLEFRVDTDKDGRFAWDSAPADEIQFDMGKQGYMSIRRKVIKADGGEIRLTMIKPLKVKGTVVDAETGKPIEAFTVLPGIDWGNGQPPFWERGSARKQSEGAYEYSFSEPRDGHLIRIEADGYLPVVSRHFRDAEGEVTFDARMKPGAGVSGVVLGPDGRPAAGASVCLLTPGSGAYLTNARPPDARNTAVVEAGADGKFRFPSQDGKFALVALHDGGFARVTGDDLANSPEIQLVGWGRVEGVLRVGKNPGSGEAVRLSIQQDGGPSEMHPYFDYRTIADADGHYAIERVPPGKAFVSREIKLSERTTGYSHTVPVQVASGQAARADIGGTGRPVVGHLIAPGGAKVDWAYGMNGLRAAQPKLDLPKDLSPEERAKRYREWTESPEGKAYQDRAQRNYSVKIEPDGSFRVDDVPAGDYTLSIAINEPPQGNLCGIGGELLGSATHSFSIPEMPGGRSDEPLDVGTLELTMSKRVKVGDAAPGFEVATLDGGTLKLDDYRGKFVLLDFWATWCGPCVAETPHLKAAFEAFGKDDRVALIGLSLDQEKEAPRKYVEKNGLAWSQAFLGDFSQAKLPTEYGIQGIPSIWLVGPDGKVIAKDLRGAAIKAAIEKVLAGPK
ncbi:carboxypeptidase regulatory-like domain-containing protein [Tundrisphaera sp. TA3]|uniref:carboxypeptidase regulatory-like domain-containing protein n=1 Tax=Tundrisphaera sp. TA3 TaxID=3435775 RepID=UPI003EBE477D